MTDNLGIKQPRDRYRINLTQSWEVKYWTQKFGVTEERLRQAVASVGNMVTNVENWLKIH